MSAILKPTVKPLVPPSATPQTDEEMMRILGERERRLRALTISSLLARATREPSFVVSASVEPLVKEGLDNLEDDHIEELALLLGLAEKRD